MTIFPLQKYSFCTTIFPALSQRDLAAAALLRQCPKSKKTGTLLSPASVFHRKRTSAAGIQPAALL